MKGKEKGVVLPKALTVKMIPQFADMPTATIEDNLFYSSIKLTPLFLKKQRNLTAKYTATINDKLFLSLRK
jgi:uncharacterized protein (DUF885 family)